MTETVMNRGKFQVLTEGVPAAADLRMCYFTGTATGVDDPDLNTVADLEAVAGVTVAAERIALTTETISEDDTNDRAQAGADTVSFSAAPGVTAQGVAIYYEGGGTDGTRLLLATYTTGFPQPVDGGLDVNIPNGYLRAT
jgi:hypothetical protein